MIVLKFDAAHMLSVYEIRVIVDGILSTQIIKNSGIKQAIMVGKRYSSLNTKGRREVHLFQIWLESMSGKGW